MLKKEIEAGEKFDEVIAIGPLVMMKFVCKLTEQYNIPTTVSMNPVMIDGTGTVSYTHLDVYKRQGYSILEVSSDYQRYSKLLLSTRGHSYPQHLHTRLLTRTNLQVL